MFNVYVAIHSTYGIVSNIEIFKNEEDAKTHLIDMYKQQALDWIRLVYDVRQESIEFREIKKAEYGEIHGYTEQFIIIKRDIMDLLVEE